MISPSLRAKIRNIERNAPLEVPKARLCAAVILDLAGGRDCDGTVATLKSHLGNNWSAILALQFMSGRRGEMAALAAPSVERAQLLLAHLVAKESCSAGGVGAAHIASTADLARLQEAVNDLLGAATSVG